MGQRLRDFFQLVMTSGALRAAAARTLRSWRKLLLLASFVLAACFAQPHNPSEESKFLQNRLIPDMIRWSKGKADTFPLGHYLSSQSFDTICTVAEYQPLSKIEKEQPSVRKYRGARGEMVPETRIAIIGVKDDVAHVGYLIHREFGLYNHGALCSAVQKTVLIRDHDKDQFTPSAVINEVN